jgi:hypothetical protein
VARGSRNTATQSSANAYMGKLAQFLDEAMAVWFLMKSDNWIIKR